MNRRHFIASTAATLFVPTAFAEIRETTVASLDELGQRVVHRFNERWMCEHAIKAVTILKAGSRVEVPEKLVWVLSAGSMETLAFAQDTGNLQPIFSNPRTVIAFMPFGFEPISRHNACQALVQHGTNMGAKVIPVDCQGIGEKMEPGASLADVTQACEIWAAGRLRDLLADGNGGHAPVEHFHV